MDRRRKHSPGWGGRRKGAGAPPGNLNALVHGNRSSQIRQIRDLLTTDRRVRQILARVARAEHRRRAGLSGRTIKKIGSRRT